MFVERGRKKVLCTCRAVRSGMQVRLAVESIKAESDAREAGRAEEVDAIRAAALEADTRCQQLEAVLGEWESAVTARDEEIRNLQVCRLSSSACLAGQTPVPIFAWQLTHLGIPSFVLSAPRHAFAVHLQL